MFRKSEHRGRRGRRTGKPDHAERHRPVHLSELKAGDTARIVSFHGGKGFREKMSGMGLFPGIEIEVVQTDGDEGMMLICVGGTRLMLCRRMAGKIHLERT
jgi:ferrous iron transport protein A